MKYVTYITKVIAAGTLALVLAVGLVGQSLAASDPIKLVMVGAWPPKVSSAADIGIKYLKTVNEMAGGRLVIEF